MKKALLISTILTGGLIAEPAGAADVDALMQQMKAMQAQMATMQREMNAMRDELAQAKAQSKASEKVIQAIKDEKVSKKPENDVKISMVPAPKFETADGAYSFKLGGFAQADAGMFSDDRRDHPDGTTFRRARLNASGTIAHDFNYKLENDFANNASTLTDVYLEYTGFKPGQIPVSLMAGQFKEPFGLETLTSDLFTTFIERSLTFAFSPDRNIGVAVSARDNSSIGLWTASIGGFGSGTGTASTDDEARDITGRFTLAPIATGREVLHFGVAGSHRIPLSLTDSMRFASKFESSLPSSQAVDTTVTFVNDVNLLGLEAAGVYGPFSMQGEYVRAHVDRRGGRQDQTFDAFYVEASYFLTGESRNYSNGKFDRVKPRWAFSLKEDGWGAFQVAARYSHLDLNDTVIRGGELTDKTLSLRWIPLSNVSFSLNYIMADADQFSVTPNDSPRLLTLRSQFDF